MSIRARIVVSVALQEVDNAPNAKTCSESDNECLQNAYCAVEKCHIKTPFCRVCGCPASGQKAVSVCRRIKKPPSGKGGCPRAA